MKMIILWTLGICFLTLYAPSELTRVIVVNMGLHGKFIFEVCLIWVFYIIAMVIVYKFVKEKHEHIRTTN